MLDAATNAITQMFSPALRAVLWRTIGLSLLLIVVAGVALQRLVAHLLDLGSATVETSIGPHAHDPAYALAWLLSFAAGLGIVVGSIFLMPAVTAVVGSFYADRIGDAVEHEYYSADPAGKAMPLVVALWEGFKTALLAVVIYLCAVPLVLFAGFGAVIFFIATAYILGREYFELAAMRFRSPPEAKLLRKRNATTVFLGGLLIAAFVSIPIVNLATPLFAMALMVHVHKKAGARSLVAPA